MRAGRRRRRLADSRPPPPDGQLAREPRDAPLQRELVGGVGRLEHSLVTAFEPRGLGAGRRDGPDPVQLLGPVRECPSLVQCSPDARIAAPCSHETDDRERDRSGQRRDPPLAQDELRGLDRFVPQSLLQLDTGPGTTAGRASTGCSPARRPGGGRRRSPRGRCRTSAPATRREPRSGSPRWSDRPIRGAAPLPRRPGAAPCCPVTRAATRSARSR